MVEFEESYQNLMTAIVIQAVTDYLEYRYKAENATDTWERHHAEHEVSCIEEFFCSERFMFYSDMDGKELLMAIQRMPPQKPRRGRGSNKHVW